MSKIFISYSSCDRLVAEELCKYLEERDIPCWIAFRDITSGNFSGEITRALRNSDIMVVICSKESCRSEHVKNEVTLAFNQKKHIVPYLLEDNPFDDDLEYFLSLKQHIKKRGSQEKDFLLIEKFIRDYRGDKTPVAEPAVAPSPVPAVPEKPNSSAAKTVIPVVVGLAILGGAAAWYFLGRPQQEQTPAPVAQTVVQPAADKPSAQQTQPAPQETKPAAQETKPAVQETKPAAQATKPAAQQTAKPAAPKPGGDANTFTGKVTNGYPNGFGTYTFKTRRRIDMHDPEERYAEPGDYIKGDFKEGHLNYGNWFDAAGNKKAFIQLGDHPDVGADQKLGACVSQ